jgi:hypothetical protein
MGTFVRYQRLTSQPGCVVASTPAYHICTEQRNFDEMNNGNHTLDQRTPYHRFGPQIELLQEKAKQSTEAFNEAMEILQSIKAEVVGAQFSCLHMSHRHHHLHDRLLSRLNRRR